MTRYVEKKYQLTSNKIKKSVKIMLISDLHISRKTKKAKINKIIDVANKEKCQYICISGDLVDGVNTFDDEHAKQLIFDFVKELCKISKVIISIGNHDVARVINNKFHNKLVNEALPSFFNELRSVNNVKVLDNEMYCDGKVNFIGFTPSYNSYLELENSLDLFLNDMNSFYFKLSPNKYNILLCHSPMYPFDDKILNNAQMMDDIDLVLSGHMHNGMVPPIIDRAWKGNRGLVTPYKQLLPKDVPTRGIKEKRGKHLIVSGGITKLSASSPTYLRPFNHLFPMNIEIITINNS